MIFDREALQSSQSPLSLQNDLSGLFGGFLRLFFPPGKVTCILPEANSIYSQIEFLLASAPDERAYAEMHAAYYDGQSPLAVPGQGENA